MERLLGRTFERQQPLNCACAVLVRQCPEGQQLGRDAIVHNVELVKGLTCDESGPVERHALPEFIDLPKPRNCHGKH
jgi:hypothetical protein